MKSLQKYEVSDRLPVREWVPTQVQVRQYAEASGDYNPIHLDDNYARQAGLGGVIAHGMLTMAQMAAMLTEWIGTEGIISNLEVRFEQMVRPGDKIKFYGFVKERLENCLICNIEAVNAQMEKVLTGSTSITIIL
ncbi:MaoC family protein [Desulfosporosinus sp. I2]|uniref:MaoC family dehydratase n=1 Tax=Desulfosporosinus sp. I2 TaxID=1617025 RepID=UPI0005EFA1FE|nr:MaoC/PaaZ C-terminal domain-containing protein [Desulfosporosinus sp. I2]KJR48311.1 MaoC family protein [Desulfosporosinus sp. I2]